MIDVPLVPLGEIRQAGEKLVTAFAAAMDVDPDAIGSNIAEIEWPRDNGRQMATPEIDAARWLSLAEARRLMLSSQTPLFDALEGLLRAV